MEDLDGILSYLTKYSSKKEPKSIDDIAETLAIDNQAVGYAIHELLKHRQIFSVVNDSEIKYYVLTIT